jgi:hypothetical protein
MGLHQPFQIHPLSEYGRDLLPEFGAEVSYAPP